MFNKNNNVKSFEFVNQQFFKQYNNISITPAFALMLNNYYENKNMQEHLDFDGKIKMYRNKKFENSVKKQYNSTITNLYDTGNITIDNQTYPIKTFYIVYERHENKFHLMCIDSKYRNERFSYDKAIKLIDTSAFIKLVKSNLANDNTIVIKKDELLQIIHDWDGTLHRETSVTDAIDEKMMGNEYNEG